MHSPQPSQIIKAKEAPVGGMTVQRPLPTRSIKSLGPFIFFDHFGPHKLVKDGTVPPHPHAGFQTVTYLLNGKGQHTDSSGASHIIEAGGVNWMTAGKGIVHAERMMADDERGIVEGFQIWVNLPRKDKYAEPGFEGYAPAALPKASFPGGNIRVIAGSWTDHVSPVHTFSPLFLYHIELSAGTEFTLPVDADHELGIYVVKGSLHVADQLVPYRHLVQYAAGTSQVPIKAQADSVLIVFGGTPLNEPMATYGPFVMSTQAELKAVMADYEQGKMGEVTDW